MADASTTGTHANVYVERVEVRNFKGIERLSVDLSPGLTLLVGRNNAGKSRILRALHVAVGREPAERDDLTVGLADQAEIDVVIAPRSTVQHNNDSHSVTEGDASAPDEQKFDEALQGLFGTGLALVSFNPDRQRFAWRTTVASVSDGRGARTQTSVLAHVANTGEWQATNTPLPRAVGDLVYAELVDTRRDLDQELRRQGTPIRKILNDLQVEPSERVQLEQELAKLGDDILLHSETLKGLRDSLNSLDRYVDAIGDARVDPVPRTLEELARTVGVSFVSGEGPLASRLHGSGVRSLASLLAQDVFYSQTLGIDGGDIRPHPVTLIEEPESHLHPHAIVEVAGLLSTENRQVVATTHAPLLAMTVAPGSLRLIRRNGTGHESIDFGPAEPSDDEAARTKQLEFYASEMEKLKRLVERPFGELLFARAVVIGDGATERAFLPTVLRDALGPLAHGISVIDSAGMIDVVRANVKFSRHVGIPLVVFADGDTAGARSVTALVNEGLLDEPSEVVWSGTRERERSDAERGGAIERMMISADREACVVACQSLNVSVEPGEDLLKVMKGLKGTIGAALAHEFVLRHPYSPDADWPEPLQRLVQLLEPALDTVVGEGET